MSKKRKLVLWLMVIGIVGILLFALGTRISAEDVVTTIRGFGPWGPVIFILLTLTTYVAAPLSGTPFFFAGWVLFGEKVVLYIYLTQTLSAVIDFWIARIWGQKIVLKLAGEKNMQQINSMTNQYGIKTLVFLRLIMGAFYDIISYAYGLTNIRFRTYFLVSLLAPIPYSLFFKFYILEKVDNLGQLTLWYSVLLVPAYLFAMWFWKKKRKNLEKSIL